VDTWDSTAASSTASTTSSSTSSNSLPQGIRAQITLAADEPGSIAQTPIELVVPIAVQPGTNSAAGTGGGG